MWETVKLGDVCDFQNGRAFKKSEWSESGLPIIRIQNLKNETTEHNFYDGEYDERIFVANGDLLLSWSGTVKPFIWCHGDALLNQHVFKISVSRQLHQGYAFYLFQNILDEISKKKVGIGLQHITKKTFENFPITLPPLAEQQRIVTKLDAAFAEIDRAIELTREKLLSSQHLFTNSLDSLVNATDVGKSILLGEVCELAQGLAINKGTKHLLVDEVSSKPLIRIKDLVNETEEQYITEDYENPKTEISENDLIFTRTGSLGLVFRGRKGVLHNNSFKVTPTEQLSKDYLYWWLKNPSFLSDIHRIAGKAAQPDISHKLFKAQEIMVPSISKQKEIVTKVELIYEQTEQLACLNKQRLSQLTNLKSAILTQELQPSQSEAA